MTGTARILASFWQPRSRRFCELTAGEIRERCGMTTDCSEFRQLVQHKVIRWSTIPSDSRVKTYRLAPEGERRVSAMIVLNTLPKIGVRLTAIPQEGK